ncbi:MAG: hypothetical protein U5R30_19755 [Deltaproteobacteria bacterium]|nr:hypothetical protein [Deltaproteobacteria bacterium]
MTLILSDCRMVSHVAFDATQNEFPSAALPERLNGLANCPGTIRLRPFGRLAEEDFLEDYRINLLGAVKTIQVCHAPLKKASLRTAPASCHALFFLRRLTKFFESISAR